MTRKPGIYDAVVIGSGVSGLAAALTVAEGGGAALVCEKQPALGGTSNFFNGIFAVDSDMPRYGVPQYHGIQPLAGQSTPGPHHCESVRSNHRLAAGTGSRFLGRCHQHPGRSADLSHREGVRYRRNKGAGGTG